MSPANTLAIHDLTVSIGGTPILKGVSFDVAPGQVMGLVGESGSGKSMTALAIMGLLPPKAEASGDIRLQDVAVPWADDAAMRKVRGREVGMIFQEPMTALNPLMTIGDQVAETIRVHTKVSNSAALETAARMLERVGLSNERFPLSRYPHELSGGQRQRVAIAIAIALTPKLLIADEPTTALDVTVQAQVLDLIADLRRDLAMSVILITHDLGVVANAADRMMVMYAGRIVEEAPVEKLFARPSHGYTAGLLQSLPGAQTGHRSVLNEIPGSVPRLDKPVAGCVYAPRCSFATDACAAPLPPAQLIEPQHTSRCIHPDRVYEGIRNTEIVSAWA